MVDSDMEALFYIIYKPQGLLTLICLVGK